MRSLLIKYALRGILALAGFAAFIYVADDLWARHQGRPVEQIKVDQVYSERNKYDELQYSAGAETMQTCVDALLPHFGFPTCWYLRRHTLQQIGDR